MNVVTSSLLESAELHVTTKKKKRQLAWPVGLCDLEQGGVVINDAPPTPLLSEASETSAIASFNEIGKIWLHTYSNTHNLP